VLVASILSEITEAITSAIGDYGLYAVFLLMLIDAVLPAASEVVMVYGGALASGAFAGQEVVLFGQTIEEGFPAYLAIALAGTIGYLIGAVGGWAIGLYGGRPFLERRGRWFHLDEKRLQRAEAWFDRWGEKAVFLGRVTPVARSFVSIPAGVFGARLLPYTLLTLLGSAIWCFAFAGAGYLAGENWEDFHHAFRYVEYLVAAAIVAAAVWLVVRYRRRRRNRLAEDSPSG
jgi:membrane protein DedA with SNARE-associated domain